MAHPKQRVVTYRDVNVVLSANPDGEEPGRFAGDALIITGIDTHKLVSTMESHATEDEALAAIAALVPSVIDEMFRTGELKKR